MARDRMLNKQKEPTWEEIAAFIGDEGLQELERFEEIMSQEFDLKKELKFPFGNNYGWGYKYSNKSKHLCYLFFEAGGVNGMIQIGDALFVDAIQDELSDYGKQLWENRYPCGKKGGGWVHYPVENVEQVEEVCAFVRAKLRKK